MTRSNSKERIQMLATIKVIEDSTENYFGVEGYKVELSTKRQTIPAFINTKNIISVDTGVYLHGLFKPYPYTSEFVDKVQKAMNAALVNWHPELTSVEVRI